MFRIYDGRPAFYQWDSNCRLIVDDSSITQVHFFSMAIKDGLTCETYSADGTTVVDVPNIFFQNTWQINCYAYDGSHTMHVERFKVQQRPKPSDYVYTETEVKHYGNLEENLAALEDDLDNLKKSHAAMEGNMASLEEVQTAMEKDMDTLKENTNDLQARVEDLEEKGGGGGGEAIEDAVRYTPQELTEEQKARARENIGAAPDDGPGELPEVTVNDAGKFLRVSSSGAWVAETIPNAKGVSF